MYRVVQESLTNVRKHAGPGATAAVRLGTPRRAWWSGSPTTGAARRPHGPAAGPDGPGHGLAGMRERIELYGGIGAVGAAARRRVRGRRPGCRWPLEAA